MLLKLILSVPLIIMSCNDGNQKKQEENLTESSAESRVIVSSDTTRKNLVQENLFDGEDFLHGFVQDQSCCDYSVQQVNGALRFEVRKTDNDISGSKRAEVTGKGYSVEDRWYGFRVRLEDWVDDNAGEHIIQWHPNDKTGSANVSLWTSGGMYTLVVSPDGHNNNYYELDTITANVNVDFVMHIKWSDTNAGIVEIWKDGKYITKTVNEKTLPYKGITSTQGCYLKLGVNKFGWSYEPAKTQSTSSKRVLYFEEFREGNEMATYEDVKPGKKL